LFGVRDFSMCQKIGKERQHSCNTPTISNREV
jgi:hypothetical protein